MSCEGELAGVLGRLGFRLSSLLGLWLRGLLRCGLRALLGCRLRSLLGWRLRRHGGRGLARDRLAGSYRGRGSEELVVAVPLVAIERRPEIPEAPPERASDLRQSFWPEHQQSDH
jgi:hypothetical protein